MWRCFRSWTSGIFSHPLGGSHCRLVSTSTSANDKDTDCTLNSSPQSEPISDLNNETNLDLNCLVNNRFLDPIIKKQLSELKNTLKDNEIDNPHLKSLASKTKFVKYRKKSKGSSELPLSNDTELLKNISPKPDESSPSEKIYDDCVPETLSNPEEFGTLASIPLHDGYVGDPLDVKTENEEIPNHSERKEINYYAAKMKTLINEGKLQEALDVIEKEMPSVRAWPDTYCYRTIIRGCAIVGDTKKAFSLYNQMKKRGLRPKPRIWAQLFVACSNSYSQQDGLSRATKLRNQLIEAGAPLTDEVYHTMIRAFGRCGDINSAFAVMDDMVASRIPVTNIAYNSLLHACLFDKEAGFRHAIMVWRRMRLMFCKPDLYSYNLIVRCTQCGAGDPALLAELLRAATEQPEETRKRRNEQLFGNKGGKQLSAAQRDDQQPVLPADLTRDKTGAGKRQFFSSLRPQTSEKTQDSAAASEAPSSVAAVEPFTPPNILAVHPSPGSVFQLKELNDPSDRLAVLGGTIGVLHQMERDRVDPDIKTFTVLLSSLPHTLEAEEALLRSMEVVGVEPNIIFCNVLIRRRALRRDGDQYKMGLSLLSKYRLLPNIVTYGSLALTCRTLPDARNLLADMASSGHAPNLTIMKSLLGCALRSDRYFYALEMLRATHQYQLQPDEQMLEELEERGRIGAKQSIRKLELLQEKGYKLNTSDEAHLNTCHTFLLEYRQWLQNSSVRRKEMPWAYRKDDPPLEQSYP